MKKIIILSILGLSVIIGGTNINENNIAIADTNENRNDFDKVMENIEKSNNNQNVEARAERELKKFIFDKTGLDIRMDIVMCDSIKGEECKFENYIFQIENCSKEIYSLKSDLVYILKKYKSECKNIKLQLGYEIVII